MIVTDRKFDQAQSTAKKLGGNRISWILSRVSPNEMFIFCVNNYWHVFSILFMKLCECLT